ncbi:MAG: ankyrin repeat domain-containing protein, partial [Rubripirellula sp.]
VRADYDHPQPALWTRGALERQRGRQQFPVLYEGEQRMHASGRHFQEDANVIVDGRRVSGEIMIDDEHVQIELAQLPKEGMHLLQVQSVDGMFSNDFIFHVTKDADEAGELKRSLNAAPRDRRAALANAASRGDLRETRRLLNRGAEINARKPEGGSTPLGEASLHGHVEVVRLLLKRGAKVDATNRDGNSPLHVAAFMCHFDTVRLLLEHGASPQFKNERGETAIEVVDSAWSEPLGQFYSAIGAAIGRDAELGRVERDRPRMADLLKGWGTPDADDQAARSR